jgi:hypothetical protein
MKKNLDTKQLKERLEAAENKKEIKETEGEEGLRERVEETKAEMEAKEQTGNQLGGK